jgi:hypothetical protein
MQRMKVKFYLTSNLYCASYVCAPFPAPLAFDTRFNKESKITAGTFTLTWSGVYPNYEVLLEM